MSGSKCNALKDLLKQEGKFGSVSVLKQNLLTCQVNQFLTQEPNKLDRFYHPIHSN